MERIILQFNQMNDHYKKGACRRVNMIQEQGDDDDVMVLYYICTLKQGCWS